MNQYIWESKCGIQDVIKDFIAFTDNPNLIDRNMSDYKTFDYKDFGLGSYQFTLCFNYGAWYRISYDPEPIKGVIRVTTSGCRIEAYKQRWFTITRSIILLVFVAVFYAAAFSAPIAGFKGSIAIGILFGIFATCTLGRFLYTRNKWKSANDLLDLIDRMSNAQRQHRY